MGGAASVMSAETDGLHEPECANLQSGGLQSVVPQLLATAELKERKWRPFMPEGSNASCIVTMCSLAHKAVLSLLLAPSKLHCQSNRVLLLCVSFLLSSSSVLLFCFASLFFLLSCLSWHFLAAAPSKCMPSCMQGSDARLLGTGSCRPKA